MKEISKIARSQAKIVSDRIARAHTFAAASGGISAQLAANRAARLQRNVDIAVKWIDRTDSLIIADECFRVLSQCETEATNIEHETSTLANLFPRFSYQGGR